MWLPEDEERRRAYHGGDDLDEPAEVVFYCPECPERGVRRRLSRGPGLRFHPAHPNLHHWSDGLLCLRTGHPIMNTSKKATIRETCGARTLGPHWICARFAATTLFDRPLARLCRRAVLPARTRGRGGTRLLAHVSHLAVSLAGAQAFGRGRGCPRRFGGAQGRSDFRRVGTYAARLRLRMVRASLPVARV